MAAAEPELTQNLGRTPTRAEAADGPRREPEDISTALAADGCFSAMSLDAPSRFDTRVTLGDLIVDDSDDFRDVERHDAAAAGPRGAEGARPPDPAAALRGRLHAGGDRP